MLTIKKKRGIFFELIRREIRIVDISSKKHGFRKIILKFAHN
jgi:hypothetical protein